MASKGQFLAEKLIKEEEKVAYAAVRELPAADAAAGPTVLAALEASDGNWTLGDAALDELSFGDGVPNMDAVSGDLQTVIIFMYSVTALLSLVGNACVIVVLACGRKSSVRGYLINLAVSDIAMAVFCIPFTYTSFMYNKWIFAPWFCAVATFMQHAAVTCSVYTLVIIGIDRYNALVHPLTASWTKSRSAPALVGVWAVSFSVASVQLAVTSARRVTWGQHHYYQCAERWPPTADHLYEKCYTVAILLVTFLLPLTSLAHSYISIVSMMCQHKLPGNADAVRDRQRSLSKAKAINMMAVVVVCFTLCWLPMHVLMLLITFHKSGLRCSSDELCLPYYLSVFACHWVAMSNSFMNPFIYCFMSNNFREDLLQFARRCRGRARPHASLRSSDVGSSGRTALYIGHRSSTVRHSPRPHRARSSSDSAPQQGCHYVLHMTARDEVVMVRGVSGGETPSHSAEMDHLHTSAAHPIPDSREAFDFL